MEQPTSYYVHYEGSGIGWSYADFMNRPAAISFARQTVRRGREARVYERLELDVDAEGNWSWWAEPITNWNGEAV